MRVVLLNLIRIYQRLLSPLFPPACRYVPTCSEYALQAVESQGALRGSFKALGRLLRCHPLARGGYDPVEQIRESECATAHRHGHECPAP
jgi:putative membrane protein insertion efficiency factor